MKIPSPILAVSATAVETLREIQADKWICVGLGLRARSEATQEG